MQKLKILFKTHMTKLTFDLTLAGEELNDAAAEVDGGCRGDGEDAGKGQEEEGGLHGDLVW